MVKRYLEDLDKTIIELSKRGYTYPEIKALKKNLETYKTTFSELEDLAKKGDEYLQITFKREPELLDLLRKIILSHPSEVVTFLQKRGLLKRQEVFFQIKRDLHTLRNLGSEMVQLTKRLDLISRETLEKKLRILKIIQILFFGFFSIFILLGIILITRSILERLKVLDTLIEETQKGNFRKIKLFKISDELDLLIYKFYIMEEKLKEREEVIERQRRELFQAQKMAALGRLLTKISHELNNPINNLYLTVQFLNRMLSQEEKERFQEYYEDLQRQIRRIKQIIESFLLYSKRAPLKKEKILLKKFLQGVWDSLLQDFSQKEVSFELEIQEDLELKGDPLQLELVFRNLFKNACEAMQGKGHLKVKALRQGERILIEVSDTGPGISERVREHLFEPFFSTKPEGIGIGLSLSKEIIERHGGRLFLKETSEKGTTFGIELPV